MLNGMLIKPGWRLEVSDGTGLIDGLEACRSIGINLTKLPG